MTPSPPNASPAFTGLVAAVHTPFDAGGELRTAAVEAQAEHLHRGGVRAVFVAGTTGEGTSLTQEERVALTERWCAVARGSDLRVIVHVGGGSVRAGAELARHAREAGAHAVAALPPHFLKLADVASLTRCLEPLSAAAPDLPLYYYDIPGLSGVALPMLDFLEEAAARLPNLRGIKYTNPDLAQLLLCLRAEGGRFDVLWGSDEALLGGLATGARGAVGSSYNFAAPLYVRLIEAFEARDLERARELQARSAAMIRTIARYGYLAAAKRVMSFVGVDCGPARAPLEDLDAEEERRLRADLERIGFFGWAVS